MAYSTEFRRAVAEAYDECGSSIGVAGRFECRASWVRRLMRRRGLADSLAPLEPRLPDNRVLTDAGLGGKASVPTAWRTTRRHAGAELWGR